MFSRHTDPIPDFVIDAIDGARELSDAIDAAEAARRAAALKIAPTGEAARAAVRGPLNAGSPTPSSGTTYPQMTKALDAYNAAQTALTAAERALYNAQRKRLDHVLDGMTTPDFIERHEPIMDAATDRAKAALAELDAAVRDRDELALMLGRQLQTVRSWFGLGSALGEIREYVEAASVDANTAMFNRFREHFTGGISATGKSREAWDAAQRIRDDAGMSLEAKREAYGALMAQAQGIR